MKYFQSRKIMSVFALEGSYTQTLLEKSKMASIWINHKIEIFLPAQDYDCILLTSNAKKLNTYLFLFPSIGISSLLEETFNYLLGILVIFNEINFLSIPGPRPQFKDFPRPGNLFPKFYDFPGFSRTMGMFLKLFFWITESSPSSSFALFLLLSFSPFNFLRNSLNISIDFIKDVFLKSRKIYYCN